MGWMLMVLLGLLAGGCAPVQAPIQTDPAPAWTASSRPSIATTIAVISPSPTTSHMATASATIPPAADLPTATPSACLQDSGQIAPYSLASPHLKEPLEVWIYTPPCYDQWADHDYPALYFFHGANNNLEQLERLAIGKTADDLIRAGEIEPLLIVMPQETLFYRPSRTGFDEAILETLMPWVEDNYRTRTGREQRAVGGLSRGGAWAVHFGIKTWQQFGSVGAHSAAAFLEDAKLLAEWLEEVPRTKLPRIYMDIGDRDYLQESNTWLADTLNNYNVPHEYYVFPGYHDEPYWSAHLADYLRWYDAGWEVPTNE